MNRRSSSACRAAAWSSPTCIAAVPAFDAGVHIGDIVTAVDGKAVRSAQDTLAQIAAKKPGSHVQLHLVRGAIRLDATLAVTERPQAS